MHICIMDNRKIWHTYHNSDGQIIQKQIPFEELPWQNQRGWYHGICSETEIDRILNVQKGKDYILKLRADTIVDNIRLWRVYRHISNAWGKDWALEKYFNAYSYINVRKAMPKEKQEICKQVSFGSIISSDPNGLIFETPYGICSTYSEYLRYFTRYSCLALLEFKGKVPWEVRFQAMRIAIRVMLQSEVFDFEVAPRGIIPKESALHLGTNASRCQARYNNILNNAPRPYDFDKIMYCEDLPQLVSYRVN